MRFLFKQSRPRQFDFKPRFYDERKERLKARIASAQQETPDSHHEQSKDPEILRMRMQSAWRSDDRRTTIRKSNRSVFIIAGLLVIIAYLLLK